LWRYTEKGLNLRAPRAHRVFRGIISLIFRQGIAIFKFFHLSTFYLLSRLLSESIIIRNLKSIYQALEELAL